MSDLEILRDIFRDVFDAADMEISEATTSSDIEDWDSVAQVNLVLTIESEFGVRFTTAEATETHSVREFLAIIRRQA